MYMNIVLIKLLLKRVTLGLFETQRKRKYLYREIIILFCKKKKLRGIKEITFFKSK